MNHSPQLARLIACFLHGALCGGTYAQTAAFTYQGRLNDGGSPATGIYDVRFAIYDAASAGTQQGNLLTNAATGITNAVFTVSLDFGAAVFDGSDRWLELSVRTNGASSFTPLIPRQKITAAPYAITASNLTGNLPAAQVTGPIANGQLASSSVTISPGTGLSGGGTVALGGTTTLNNAGVLSVTASAPLSSSGGQNPTLSLSGPVDAATLGGQGASNFWQSGGNNVLNGQFLGSTNNQPLDLHANNQRALRLEPTTGTPNVLGGAGVNATLAGVTGATIAGGGSTAANNRVTDNYGSVGGGNSNLAGDNSGTTGDRPYATVAGGNNNWAAGDSSTVAGGLNNSANGFRAAIGGGEQNAASGSYSVIPGGLRNGAFQSYTFAAGRRAKANNDGTFVWADSTDADFTSASNNTFLIRAGGGVGINTNNPGTNALQVIGTVAATKFVGAGSGLTGISGAAIAPGSITGVQLASGAAVTSLNGITNAVTLVAGANISLATNGSQLTIASSGGGNFWSLGGNAGTAAGTHFLGTTDNQALELKVNGGRALRLEPNITSGAPNIIGGAVANNIQAGAVGVTISGGGATNYVHLPTFGGYVNLGATVAASDFATIGGGADHFISSNSPFATIAGGLLNFVDTNSESAVIGGGLFNTVKSNAPYATVAGGIGNIAGGPGAFVGGGGYDGLNFPVGTGNYALAVASSVVGGLHNQILTGSDYSFVGGGANNQVGLEGFFSASAFGATICGGQLNTNYGTFGAIPGGMQNLVAGSYSLAAGRRAKANHTGTFVWADSQNTDFGSTAVNQFLVRASGGVGINNSSPATALDVTGEIRSSVGLSVPGNLPGSGTVISRPGFGRTRLISSSWSASTGDYVDIEVPGNDSAGNMVRITSRGNLGIGTTAPDATLSVNGTADKPGGGSWSTFSDGRLKDVGGEFHHGLEALAKVQPVHYRYKAGNPLNLPSQPEFVGVVAQQVRQAIPEAVDQTRDGYLTVNNDPIIWTMVNAIKELNKKVEGKNIENAELKTRLEKLEQLINSKLGGAK